MGQKLMVFHYPYVDYANKYSDDLELLEAVGTDKYMEIAISFDKGYSIDEVNDMMPKSVNITWFWVDAIDDEDKENQKYRVDEQENSIYAIQYLDLCYENHAYGFKTINEYGETIKEPEAKFIDALIHSGKTHIYEAMASEDEILTKNDIEIQGVVVTGETKDLITLKELPCIKASSIGIITDKY